VPTDYDLADIGIGGALASKSLLSNFIYFVIISGLKVQFYFICSISLIALS
jgi:hypothetical protein